MSVSRSVPFVLSLLVLATFSLAAVTIPGIPWQEAEEEEQQLEFHHYQLKSGKSLRAAVLERDGGRYSLHVSIEGGRTIGWYNFADFAPSSQVKLLESQVGDDDVAGQLEVAEFAVEQGLIELGRKELRRLSHMTDAVDPAQLVDLKPRAIELTVKLVNAYCAEGKVSEARNGVSRILVRKADRLTEAEKDRLMQAVEAGAARNAEKKAAARSAKDDERATRERQKKLAPVYKELDQAKKLRREGLLASKSYTKASRILKKAIKKFESVLKDVAKLRERYADDRVTQLELDDIEHEARQQGKDTLLANASLDLARGKFHDAMGAVNRILAENPQDQQALAMRARIEVAQNDWGW